MSYRLGLLAAAACALMWGFMFAVLKHVLAVADPYWVTTIRYVSASAIMALVLLIREGRNAFSLDRRSVQLFWIGTAGVAVFNLFMANGVQRSSAEHGALLVACTPAMVAFIAWARTRVAPPPITLSMIALALTGVLIVVTKGRLSALTGGSAFGDGLVAFGTLGFAIYTAYTPAFNDYSRLRFTTLTVIAGTITTVLATIIATALGVAHFPAAFDAGTAYGIAYLTVSGVVFAFILWSAAISAIGAPNAALFLNAVPVVAIVVGIALGRHFSLIEYCGAAMTLVALFVNNIATRPNSVSEPAPLAIVGTEAA